MTDPKHIVCPHCGGINRVPGERSAAPAHCGTCKASLFDGKPLAVDAASFDRHTTRNDIAVLVDVWAPWCGPCRSMRRNSNARRRCWNPISGCSS